jgi:hypothetical protein
LPDPFCPLCGHVELWDRNRRAQRDEHTASDQVVFSC